MEREQRTDRITVPEGHFAGYDVYDQNRQRIGEVESLFLDENDQPEYIGVKMGVLGSQSTLIPIGIITVDEDDKTGEPKYRLGGQFVSSKNIMRVRGPFTNETNGLRPAHKRAPPHSCLSC